jgi:hypothetical protein
MVWHNWDDGMPQPRRFLLSGIKLRKESASAGEPIKVQSGQKNHRLSPSGSPLLILLCPFFPEIIGAGFDKKERKKSRRSQPCKLALR